MCYMYSGATDKAKMNAGRMNRLAQFEKGKTIEDLMEGKLEKSIRPV